VLSGFVICHSYGERLRTTADLIRYVWLRAGRLYPLHIVLVVAFLGTDVAEWARETLTGRVGTAPAFADLRGNELVASAFLAQGLGMFSELRYNFPSWSISTEFYVCVAFGLLALLARGRVAIGAAAGLLSAAALAALWLVGERSLTDVYTFGVLRCVHGFFLGVVAYRVYRWSQGRPAGPRSVNGDHSTAITLLLAVLFLALKQPGPSDFLLPPIAAVVVVLVAGRHDGFVLRLLNVRPLAWIGKVSYSVYMVHVAVIMALSLLLRGLVREATVPAAVGPSDATEAVLLVVPPLVGTAFMLAAVGLILVTSWFTYRFLEDPCRRKAKQLASRLPAQSPAS
jgi:peptidoglycan/LPS O-acetylase OafA/YrhL